jgi:transcriptional regulator with XRE-family HTH domain
MPRRTRPDPLAAAVGNRIRILREEAGLTLEKLAYESDLGSKGHLSSLERGLVVPTVTTLQTLALGLGVRLFDLVTFPEDGERAAIVTLTRTLSPRELVSLRKRVERLLRDAPPGSAKGRRSRPGVKYPEAAAQAPPAPTIHDPRPPPYMRGPMKKNPENR